MKSVEKITATKIWFFKNINKSSKLLARLRTKEMGYKLVMSEGDITTDPMNLERLMREHYERFCVHRCENLQEMEQFFERHNLPKLAQEERGDLNQPKTVKDAE